MVEEEEEEEAGLQFGTSLRCGGDEEGPGERRGAYIYAEKINHAQVMATVPRRKSLPKSDGKMVHKVRYDDIQYENNG